MTIETDTNEPISAEDAPDYSGDPLLNVMVHLAHQGVSPAITFYTQGLVFSGRILSLRAYLEQNIKFNGGAGNALAPIFETVLAGIVEPDDAAPAPNYGYVHMFGRTYIPGQPGMPDNSSLMRIQRSGIIGWSLGAYEEGRA
ncbi:hypothetical protein EQZ23_10860 [Sphingomonas sp. UV9]|uniref:hypothetical protein n=1 Tax=Sphingomonas sp. UV9 TaxID=1851410 RepID=UPI000FFCBC80|nr:hypothetical protein [Sphingomonas sp. UV9]RXD05550.1 hypothetical protein EQZ23_10860 [Sphingomonas sp. UV9]